MFPLTKYDNTAYFFILFLRDCTIFILNRLHNSDIFSIRQFLNLDLYHLWPVCGNLCQQLEVAMTLPKFLLGLVCTTIIVTMWSLYDGANFVTVVIRAVIVLVILQIGYFCFILMKARAQQKPQVDEKAPTDAKTYSKSEPLKKRVS